MSTTAIPEPVAAPVIPTPADAGVSVSAPVVPPKVEAPSYETARQALKDKSWDDLAKQREAAPEAAAPAEAEVAAAPDFAAWVVDNDGKLHRPDGTFAEQAEIDAFNAAAPAEPEAPATPAVATTPEPIVVKLKTRNGAETEIEVTDADVADALRANHNDGMRRDEFNRRIGDVEAREMAQREFETMMETNPEHVILSALPKEKQVSIATALIAQHWDSIVDRIIEFYQDPAKRVATASDAQIAMRDNATEYDTRIAKGRYIAEAHRAISGLVPEGAAADVATRFMRDAEMDLVEAVRAQNGKPIAPDKIAAVLAPRLALYGFGQSGSATPAGAAVPAVAAPPAKSARPIARPVARPANAAAVTQRPTTAVTGPTPGETVRRTVQAQRIAAAVPPAGAGAATIKAPLVPPNATIEQASQALKKHKSWTDVTGA